MNIEEYDNICPRDIYDDTDLDMQQRIDKLIINNRELQHKVKSAERDLIVLESQKETLEHYHKLEIQSFIHSGKDRERELNDANKIAQSSLNMAAQIELQLKMSHDRYMICILLMFALIVIQHFDD